MKKVIAAVLLIVIALTGVNLLAPGWLFNATQDLTRAAANLDVKTVKAGEYTYTYADNGNTDKPVLLMIHGFTANKDNWARIALFLKDDFRVIAPDLLGHGDSPRAMDASYRISAQVARVKAFADALGLKQFHMAGSSMGGYITAMYAAQHPEQVLSATLFNNAGVVMPTPSDMVAAINNKEPHPLIIRSTEDVERFFGYVFSDAPFMTGSIENFYAEQSIPHAPLYEKIFKDFHGENDFPEPLEPLLPTISAPVLIIWGDRDRVLHVSSIDSMKPLLPQARYHVFEGVGHLPMLERPKASAQLLIDFIQP